MWHQDMYQLSKVKHSGGVQKMINTQSGNPNKDCLLGQGLDIEKHSCRKEWVTADVQRLLMVICFHVICSSLITEDRFVSWSRKCYYRTNIVTVLLRHKDFVMVVCHDFVIVSIVSLSNSLQACISNFKLDPSAYNPKRCRVEYEVISLTQLTRNWKLCIHKLTGTLSRSSRLHQDLTLSPLNQHLCKKRITSALKCWLVTLLRTWD